MNEMHPHVDVLSAVASTDRSFDLLANLVVSAAALDGHDVHRHVHGLVHVVQLHLERAQLVGATRVPTVPESLDRKSTRLNSSHRT